MKPLLRVMGVLLTSLALAPAALWAQVPAPGAADAARSSAAAVASVAAVEGTVFVTRPGGPQRLLARSSLLFERDAIHTTHNSSVRLAFTDGGETVIRPDSTLVVQAYRFQKEAPASDSLLLNLVKGGMRALTGAVGKRGNQDAYQLRANAATVGIRGTDFSARLCQNDCADVGPPGHRNSATPVAARAVQVRGSVTVSRSGAAALALQEGQPLYSGDEVQTRLQSHVVLVFSDGTRMTVNPTSQMAISQYNNLPAAAGNAPEAAAPEALSMVIDMFKGGLRVATGLIGKTRPDKVKLRTATATVGIRGTVFDVVCAASSSADAGAGADLGEMSCGGGGSLFAQTREGTIILTGEVGAPLLLPAGQSGRVPGLNQPARALPEAPLYFKELTTPAPEAVPVQLETLFGVSTLPDTSDGLLLTVHEGRVLLAQADKDILLDAGESGFAGRAAVPLRLMTTPPVLEHDPFLSSGMFRPNMCRR